MKLHNHILAGIFLAWAFSLGSLPAREWKAFPYGLLNNELVKVGEIGTENLRVLTASGKEMECPESALKEIVDAPVVTDTKLKALEKSVQDIRTTCEQLRQELKKQFDDGYLEMMVVVLAMQEKRSDGQASLSRVMGLSREQDLQKLVAACKEFDVERIIAIHNQCGFYNAFIDASVDKIHRQSAALNREKMWLDANAQVETGAEQQATQKKSADLARAMQEFDRLAQAIESQRHRIQPAKESISQLYEHYMQTFEKATQFLRWYAAIHQHAQLNTWNGKDAQQAQDIGSDWAKEMLQPETIAAAKNIATAMALLEKRRNPSIPPPRKTQPALAGNTAAQPVNANNAFVLDDPQEPQKPAENGKIMVIRNIVLLLLGVVALMALLTRLLRWRDTGKSSKEGKS